MKKYIKATMAVALGAMVLSSCEDLDTQNKSRYVTADQKTATLEMNPDMASAGVAGISASVTQCMAIFSSHCDFGYASVMLGTDLQGDEMGVPNIGYNHFPYWTRFSSPTPNGTPSNEAWYTIFKQIYACNSVAQSIGADTEVKELQFNRAQAVLTRAFDYWILAQLYQFNYDGNQSAPCVPIVTNENAAEVEQNGAPRATVEEVYAQVLKDVNEAIDLLEKSGLQPSQMVASKAKRYGSLATAYGQRARVYLTMHRYADAARDARAAITHAESHGIRCLSAQEAAVPGFTDIDNVNWMWGIPVNESDRIVTSGIINWTSMVNSFFDGGYATAGVWKFCGASLYSQIPASDVRKGWFLDENGQSKNLTSAQQAWCDSQDVPMNPYTNVKFGGYQGATPFTVAACDYPLMRIEEMYLIEAEGLAMSGGDGANALTNWVKAYRNPNFVSNATSPEGVQMEVYLQRRIELWGEGLSWYDKMRLNLPVDRTNQNFDVPFAFYVPGQNAAVDPEHALVRIYCIPEGEINGNKAIKSTDNNPSVNAPDPATWKRP